LIKSNVIRVGSRGSALALRQTEEALEQLRPSHPSVDFQVVTFQTSGDADQTSPLAEMAPSIGQGVFVKEIEQELLNGNLDMAVHSLKDLPTVQPAGLVLGAVLKRQDARDVLVNRWDCSLDKLPQGARIGTSSPRRKAQLMDLCPQAEVLPMRGSVLTRLDKALSDDYDGAVLAAAGLVRLEQTGRVAEYLSAQEFVPPPGQGVLAVEIRDGDQDMRELLRPLEDSESRYAITAERAFLEKLGGGCSMPVGAFARSTGENLLLTIFLASPDGKKCFRAKILGLPHDPLQLAGDAYMALLERGGRQLLG
jgi:hydroxymethylbilane synthase